MLSQMTQMPTYSEMAQVCPKQTFTTRYWILNSQLLHKQWLNGWNEWMVPMSHGLRLRLHRNPPVTRYTQSVFINSNFHPQVVMSLSAGEQIQTTNDFNCSVISLLASEDTLEDVLSSWLIGLKLCTNWQLFLISICSPNFIHVLSFTNTDQLEISSHSTLQQSSTNLT